MRHQIWRLAACFHTKGPNQPLKNLVVSNDHLKILSNHIHDFVVNRTRTICDSCPRRSPLPAPSDLWAWIPACRRTRPQDERNRKNDLTTKVGARVCFAETVTTYSVRRMAQLMEQRIQTLETWCPNLDVGSQRLRPRSYHGPCCMTSQYQILCALGHVDRHTLGFPKTNCFDDTLFALGLDGCRATAWNVIRRARQLLSFHSFCRSVVVIYCTDTSLKKPTLLCRWISVKQNISKPSPYWWLNEQQSLVLLPVDNATSKKSHNTVQKLSTCRLIHFLARHGSYWERRAGKLNTRRGCAPVHARRRWAQAPPYKDIHKSHATPSS